MKPGPNELYFAAEKLHQELCEYAEEVAIDELKENFYELCFEVTEGKPAFSESTRALMKTMIKMGDVMNGLDNARVAK